jgi:hypothetical protein
MDLRSLSFSFPTSIYHHLHSHNLHYPPLPDEVQKFFPARDIVKVVKLKDKHVTSRGAGKGFDAISENIIALFSLWGEKRPTWLGGRMSV